MAATRAELIKRSAGSNIYQVPLGIEIEHIDSETPKLHTYLDSLRCRHPVIFTSFRTSILKNFYDFSSLFAKEALRKLQGLMLIYSPSKK